MTKADALNFIGADEENCFDILEEKLFEIKNFLISKPIISKLFQGQVRRLIKLKEVESALGIDFKHSSIQTVNSNEFSENILASVLWYEKLKSDWKRNVMNSSVADEVLFLIKYILKVQADYLNIWPEYSGDKEGEQLISKEVDIMVLLADLKSMENAGIVFFSDLDRLSEYAAVTFHSEWKRLSLLRQMEQEWKTSLKN